MMLLNVPTLPPGAMFLINLAFAMAVLFVFTIDFTNNRGG